MSRIRSIHPGFWRDSDYVSMSAFARLLAIGLWNICDDKGTFKWNALEIKMEIFPGDNVEVSELLDEIAKTGLIMRYECGGKAFGAVKNFAKYQRPKKPNDIHPAPQDVLVYVGRSSEPEGDEEGEVPHQAGTSGENAPQMEEGGGRMEEDSPPTPQHTRMRDWPEIPDWIPVDQWNAFIVMRKRKGGMPTARAIELIIGKLERWRASGQDPGAILDQSTENQWTGIFELKEQGNGRSGASKSSGGAGVDRRDSYSRVLQERAGIGTFAFDAETPE